MKSAKAMKKKLDYQRIPSDGSSVKRSKFKRSMLLLSLVSVGLSLSAASAQISTN
jgi:hypothetical protein